jgi:hypothetical protein
MPRCPILTERQRSALFDLPTDEAALLQHYTLADDDLEHIRERRRPSNRLGFAVQLCAFRYRGRLLISGETIPLQMTKFIAAQPGVLPDDLAGNAETEVARRRHLVALRKIYGYQMFSARRVHDLKVWLDDEAEAAVSSADLVRQFAKQCRRKQTILAGISHIERLCADALVAAMPFLRCAVGWRSAIADAVVETHDQAVIVLEPMAQQWLAGKVLVRGETPLRRQDHRCKNIRTGRFTGILHSWCGPDRGAR